MTQGVLLPIKLRLKMLFFGPMVNNINFKHSFTFNLNQYDVHNAVHNVFTHIPIWSIISISCNSFKGSFPLSTAVRTIIRCFLFWKKKYPHLRFSEFFKKFLMQMNKNLDQTLIRNKTFYGKLAFFNSFFLASFPVKYNFRIRMHDILSILFSTNKKYYLSTILSFLKNIVS